MHVLPADLRPTSINPVQMYINAAATCIRLHLSARQWHWHHVLHPSQTSCRLCNCNVWSVAASQFHFIAFDDSYVKKYHKLVAVICIRGDAAAEEIKDGDANSRE